MEDFDKLWDYGNPAATETKFKEALINNTDKPLPYLLQLQTQLARTYSLRGLFDQAHRILNAVELELPRKYDVTHIRYHLERGRTFNSAGKKQEAKIQFDLAAMEADKLNEDFFLLDALHMLAIVAPHPDVAIELHKQAIIKAESSTDDAANTWLGALYNNLGWTYFDKGEYDKALSVFLRALQWRENKKSAPEIFLSKWCIARTLRALNKTDEAIKIQLALFEETTNTGEPDGYVHEELGELFLLQHDQLKFPFHFEKAYELLSSDRHLQQNEPARLERIKRLGGVAE